jgi:hypothetical protein
MRPFVVRLFRGLLAAVGLAAASAATAENPIVPGWYADPEIRIFEGRYWIYPTYSADAGTQTEKGPFTAFQAGERAKPGIWAPFLQQTYLDVFSSPDLVHWKRHERVLHVENVAWAAYALWAPSAISHDRRYYLFFGANDIKRDGQPGGIGVAVADRPQGPFATPSVIH